jgi:sugar lactone lactonase YvrE
VFIPVGRDFKGQSTAPGGYRNVDITRTFSLAPAKPGVPFYVADEYDMRTYSFQVGPDGTLSQPKLFANAGGTGAAADAQGNVYVAQDQILVFDASGKQIDTIDVPERPGSIVFGGKDGQTLFIAARTSVYAVRTKFKGR